VLILIKFRSLGTWLWRWGPALIVMAVIFTFSSFPKNSVPDFGLWDSLPDRELLAAV